MIELTHYGAQENARPLPAARGGVSTYEMMIESSAPRRSGQGAEETGQTERMQMGMAPSAAQGSAMQGMVSSAVQESSRPDTSLGPLPSAMPGISSAEQLLHSSWKSLMARNVGRSVIVSFLVGTRQTVVAQGILYEVGSDYIALYQPRRQSYISADLYSIRFMEFLPEISQTNSRQQQQ